MSFRFQQFEVAQDQCAMKVGTDGILLAAWAEVAGAKRILDIGTGTGLIALMLAQRQAKSEVVGIEIDEAAAAQASQNAAQSPFASRVTIINESIQSFAGASERGIYDLIISNPPFFSGGVLSEQAGRAEVRHTVKLSHQDLLRSVQQLLSEEGRFVLVLPWLEGLRFQELAASYQLYPQRICKVSPRPKKSPNRLLLSLGRQRAAAVESSEMCIYAAAEGLARSTVFAKLTAAFYL